MACYLGLLSYYIKELLPWFKKLYHRHYLLQTQKWRGILKNLFISTLVYLFLVYLTTLSIAQSTYHQSTLVIFKFLIYVLLHKHILQLVII